MNCTARLALPFLSPGQAQKELVHNEALQRLDVLVAAAVEEPARITPPEAPEAGSCYIVDDGATGEWTGKDGNLAAWSNAGWRFIQPPEGLHAFVRSTGLWAVRRASGWEVGRLRCSAVVIDGQQTLGSQYLPISAPAGGKTVDTE